MKILLRLIRIALIVFLLYLIYRGAFFILAAIFLSGDEKTAGHLPRLAGLGVGHLALALILWFLQRTLARHNHTDDPDEDLFVGLRVLQVLTTLLLLAAAGALVLFFAYVEAMMAFGGSADNLTWKDGVMIAIPFVCLFIALISLWVGPISLWLACWFLVCGLSTYLATMLWNSVIGPPYILGATFIQVFWLLTLIQRRRVDRRRRAANFAVATVG